ncbi:hypothetical protein BR93DRAFT_403588 [Coniochaeta sp. PMI_546]|nr:hypothetical protein BR93DRAFT_403588 [Coniochaeta sp. PMI_546]
MADRSAQGELVKRPLAAEVPDRSAVDAPIPETQVATDDCVKDLDLKTVSHVVVQISDARQKQVFASVGYQFDSNRPTPYWYFLGKITAQAIYGDPAELLLLNYVRVRTREFIGFTTATWATAVKAQKLANTEAPPLNVIEVDFEKPQPGKPLRLFCKPARGLIAERIRQWHNGSICSHEVIPLGNSSLALRNPHCTCLSQARGT